MRQLAVLFALVVLATGCSPARGQEPTPDSTSSPYPMPAPGDAVLGPPYPTNANGQTYGSGAGDTDPDLIAAYGTHGLLGYVLAVDLDEPMPTGLQTGDGQPRSIPLYDQDGVTVI